MHTSSSKIVPMSDEVTTASPRIIAHATEVHHDDKIPSKLIYAVFIHKIIPIYLIDLFMLQETKHYPLDRSIHYHIIEHLDSSDIIELVAYDSDINFEFERLYLLKSAVVERVHATAQRLVASSIHELEHIRNQAPEGTSFEDENKALLENITTRLMGEYLTARAHVDFAHESEPGAFSIAHSEGLSFHAIIKDLNV